MYRKVNRPCPTESRYVSKPSGQQLEPHSLRDIHRIEICIEAQPLDLWELPVAPAELIRELGGQRLILVHPISCNARKRALPALHGIG